MRQVVSALCVVLLLVCSGCAWFDAKNEKTAEDLAGEGMLAFEKGKYRKCLEPFQKLKDWYPFSRFAILAELKIADAHYHVEEYEEAVFAYEEFESLHPRNEAMPYVIYQIGQCHFERMDAVDRDQTFTRKALTAFERLCRQFPGDVHAEKAKKNVLRCKKNLAEHEFYVGRYYYKNKNYEAAAKRFEKALSIIPDSADTPEIRSLHQKIQNYMSRCNAGLTKLTKK